MEADAFTGDTGSNFVLASGRNDFEEEKLMRDVSLNQVPNIFFEANEVTSHPFATPASSM